MNADKGPMKRVRVSNLN